MKLKPGLIFLMIAISFNWSCSSTKGSKKTDSKGHPTPDQTPPDQTPTPIKNPLVVLSYNICWECMTHSSQGTAGSLGAKCNFIDAPLNQTTLCAKNMAQLIEAIPGQSRIKGYDFIAFQEAARWEQIKKHAPNSFQNLKGEAFKRNVDEFVTFYDQTKYTLKHRIDDGFRPNSRPFQILVFKENIIFVNLHNCHGACVSESFIDSHLSRALMANLNPTQIASLQSFRIIIAGDFNDHQAGGKIKSFQPFKTAGLNTTVSMKNHLDTCCSTSTPWTGSMGGDYIMDSESGSQISIPESYDKTKPHSDHLPVLGILTSKNQ